VRKIEGEMHSKLVQHLHILTRASIDLVRFEEWDDWDGFLLQDAAQP